jgi:hypothetical protein
LHPGSKRLEALTGQDNQPKKELIKTMIAIHRITDGSCFDDDAGVHVGYWRVMPADD